MSQYLIHVPAYLLAFEHILGGQARVTPLLTPSVYDIAARQRGPATQKALYPIIPIKNPEKLSNFIGALMIATAILLFLPITRGSIVTLAVNTFLTGAGIYTQRKMGIPFWLPCINMALGLMVWVIENRGS